MIVIVGAPITVRRGIRFAETGINVRRIQIRHFPEVDIRHPNYVGLTAVRSQSTNFSREVSVEGEIAGPGGVMAFTLGQALAFVNVMTWFAPAGGSLLLDEASVTQERSGWQSVQIRASSNPFI